jgi:tetratricopeptide (TPR) repeat protein
MSLKAQPDSLDTLNNLALRLGAGEDERLHDYPLAIRFAERGCRVSNWKDPKLKHTLAMACTNNAISLVRRGQFAAAITSLERAVEVEPDYGIALFNLAVLMLTCPDEKRRDPQKGAEIAVRACARADDLDSRHLAALARATAVIRRWDLAITAQQKAVQRATDTAALEPLRAQLRLYEKHQVPRAEAK